MAFIFWTREECWKLWHAIAKFIQLILSLFVLSVDIVLSSPPLNSDFRLQFIRPDKKI